jgi:type II secretory pathway predicted ATPase ExeA
MYRDFFKFRKNPFHITPDPDFLFLSPSHQDAFTSIFWGIQQRKGLVAVTGEVGVGKTTILRSYLEEADPERIRTVYIFNAALSFGKLMKQIVSELGIPAVDKDLPDLIDRIFLHLIDEYKNDRRVVLIIDEAQNLPVETLERFQMLSNRETSQEKLLQIILVGQLEFENKLNLPKLRQLKQQIATSTRIKTLTPDESFAYIQHRLMIASSFHNPVFTKAALKRIVKEANGIPRKINILCDNALITAFGYQRKPVDAKIIEEVIKDLRGGQPEPSFNWRIVWVPALVVFWGLVVVASVTLLKTKEISPVRKEILSAKVLKIAPVPELVKEPVVKPPVGSAPKAEPEPFISEAKATGIDKGVSEIVPPASVQLEIPGQAQAPAAENATAPNDGGVPAQRGITTGPKSRSHRYVIRIGSFEDREKAEEMKTRLEEKGYNVSVKTLKQQASGKVFVLQLRSVNGFSRAAKLMEQLSSEVEGEPEIIKVRPR